MANTSTAHLMAVVSALGLSLGVAFDGAVAAPPAPAGDTAATAPDADASARSAGYDLKAGKARVGADERRLVAVKTKTDAQSDAAELKGSVTQKGREAKIMTVEPK